MLRVSIEVHYGSHCYLRRYILHNLWEPIAGIFKIIIIIFHMFQRSIVHYIYILYVQLPILFLIIHLTLFCTINLLCIDYFEDVIALKNICQILMTKTVCHAHTMLYKAIVMRLIFRLITILFTIFVGGR